MVVVAISHRLRLMFMSSGPPMAVCSGPSQFVAGSGHLLVVGVLLAGRLGLGHESLRAAVPEGLELALARSLEDDAGLTGRRLALRAGDAVRPSLGLEVHDLAC